MTSESARNRPSLMRTYTVFALILSLYTSWKFHPMFPFCSLHTHTTHILCLYSCSVFCIVTALLLVFSLSLRAHRNLTSFSSFILPSPSHICFYPHYLFRLPLSSSFSFFCRHYNLLLSSCRIVLKVSKYHLIIMLVCVDALL